MYDGETADYELNCNTLSPNVRVNGTCIRKSRPEVHLLFNWTATF